MFKEITLYGKNFTQQEIINNVFKAIHYNLNGVNISLNYLSEIRSIISKESNLILSCPIDYPDGLSDSRHRQHQTITAIRKGANCIDLVVNPIYLVNEQKSIIYSDIETHSKICKENDVTLRVMLEYRHFDKEIYYDIIRVCKILKVKYIFPSTGNFADDYTDNLIMCKMINSVYKGAKVIANGNIWKKDQYDLIRKSGIYGIRLRGNYDFSFLFENDNLHGVYK